MHCSTLSNLSRASVMFATILALFASICTSLTAAGGSTANSGVYVHFPSSITAADMLCTDPTLQLVVTTSAPTIPVRAYL